MKNFVVYLIIALATFGACFLALNDQIEKSIPCTTEECK